MKTAAQALSAQTRREPDVNRFVWMRLAIAPLSVMLMTLMLILLFATPARAGSSAQLVASQPAPVREDALAAETPINACVGCDWVGIYVPDIQLLNRRLSLGVRNLEGAHSQRADIVVPNFGDPNFGDIVPNDLPVLDAADLPALIPPVDMLFEFTHK
jgi:hypothetical protein